MSVQMFKPSSWLSSMLSPSPLRTTLNSRLLGQIPHLLLKKDKQVFLAIFFGYTLTTWSTGAHPHPLFFLLPLQSHALPHKFSCMHLQACSAVFELGHNGATDWQTLCTTLVYLIVYVVRATLDANTIPEIYYNPFIEWEVRQSTMMVDSKMMNGILAMEVLAVAGEFVVMLVMQDTQQQYTGQPLPLSLLSACLISGFYSEGPVPMPAESPGLFILNTSPYVQFTSIGWWCLFFCMQLMHCCSITILPLTHNTAHTWLLTLHVLGENLHRLVCDSDVFPLQYGLAIQSLTPDSMVILCNGGARGMWHFMHNCFQHVWMWPWPWPEYVIAESLWVEICYPQTPVTVSPHHLSWLLLTNPQHSNPVLGVC